MGASKMAWKDGSIQFPEKGQIADFSENGSQVPRLLIIVVLEIASTFCGYLPFLGQIIVLCGTGIVMQSRGCMEWGEENRDAHVADILCQMLFGHGELQEA